jgi:Putative DNA-binding domain
MITSIPFDHFGPTRIDDVVRRGLSESQLLEFKESMPFNDDGKFELLKDVSAMANAAGGTIIYGISEGIGDKKGCAIGLSPLDFDPNQRQESVAQLLNDGLEERIANIQQGPIVHDTGVYFVIRVPQSALAPHMITKGSSKPRFYLRSNTVNAPMNVRQIKEVVLRSDGAIARAMATIEERTSYWRAKYPFVPARQLTGDVRTPREVLPSRQVLLHILPLYPMIGGIDLADETLRNQFKAIPPLFLNDPVHRHRMSLTGYTNYEAVRDNQHPERSATLLRSGGLEFHAMEATWFNSDGQSIFNIWDLEEAVLRSLRSAREFAELRLGILPAIVSLRLFLMGDARFRSPHYVFNPARILPDGEALLEPLVINDWQADGELMARRMFDVVWQAWGWEQCLHYMASGERKPFREG